MSTTLRFAAAPAAAAPHTLVLGPRSWLSPSSLVSELPTETHAALAAVESGRTPASNAWVGERAFSFVALEEKSSRFLGAVRADLVQSLVQKHVPATEDVQLHVLLTSDAQALAAANALARALPLYSRKSAPPAPRTLTATFSTPSGPLSAEAHASLEHFAGAVRTAARLVDTPTAELHTTALVAEVQAVADAHPQTVKATIISGDDLLEHGLRALHGVGRAASRPPALAALHYTPSKPAPAGAPHLALVGKGIVYDTGGLNIKTGTNMPDMKTDMGGAGALLCAFSALVSSPTPPAFPITFVGCIAENAIGPLAQRPDDVVIAHSGKSIEINNTDAEGRLVLADGVSWVTSGAHAPTHVLDLATLTGAQMVTTGMHHGALLSSAPSFEAALAAAGQASGDWLFPLLYAPELLLPEFDSKVADMKNSVASRTNAQASCAGHFIEAHLNERWTGEWAHVDIAGPSLRGGRATGFGVGLVWELVRRLGEGVGK